MRLLPGLILSGVSLLSLTALAPAQGQAGDAPAPAVSGERPVELPPPKISDSDELGRMRREAAALRRQQLLEEARAAEATPAPPASEPSPGREEELVLLQQEIAALRKQQQAAQGAAAQDDKVKKQLELQQKQIETLEKMVKLLADQLKKQPPSGAAVEKLQTQVATLEARAKQAAQRDQQVAGAVDDLVEHQDAQERYGVSLPAPLKELFLPSGNNQTPLSIYGALAVGYSKFIGDANTAANGAGRAATHGGFYFGEFTPDFLLKLNEWILLEAEISVGPSASVGSFAQADFFVNDYLTIIAGRFVAPIGWFNERLNNPWINKLPADAPGSGPLLWQQVLPAMSLLGVQAQGSFYLGCSPVKLEYNAYVSNGLNVTPAAAAPAIDELANLENMTNTFNIITNDKAIGGRIGLWWPEVGLAGGISGLVNGDYVAGGFEDSIGLYALDLNYHKGNCDFRFEYGMTYQHAGDFIQANIRRQGFYTQLAYRPRDAGNRYLQNVELIYRYGYVDFRGFDRTALTLSSYATPVDVPIRRQQNEFGIDYWFYPRMVLKVAYQINDEPGFHLHDNQFISELAWGW
jgi:hypothetical protein